MQDIADRTGKSKAALHYYDSKRDLMLSFLEYLFEEFTDQVGTPANGAGVPSAEGLPAAVGTASASDAGQRAETDEGPDDAAARLLGFVDRVLELPEDDPERRRGLRTTVLELKTQAPYDDGVRERPARFDEFLVGQVRGLIEAGIDDGRFRPVDPADTARFVVTVLDGAHTEQVAVGQDVACTRRMLHDYVGTHLVADGEAVDV